MSKKKIIYYNPLTNEDILKNLHHKIHTQNWWEVKLQMVDLFRPTF